MNTQDQIKRILDLNDEALAVLAEGRNPHSKLSLHDANKISREYRKEMHEIQEKIGSYGQLRIVK